MTTQAITVLPHTRIRKDDLPPANDPFFYGWREMPQLDDETGDWVRVPLTLDDVLHPQWGDYIVQNQEHFSLCKDLFNQLEIQLKDEMGTELLHDTLINWEEPGKKGLCPDIAVIRDVQKPFRKGTFYVKRSHGHVDLVLEVTSPSTWKVDVDGIREPNKVERYAKVGVPFYIIVDDVHRIDGMSPPITVYRLGKRKRYERQVPDQRGWYWIETIALWIGPYQDWVSWYEKKGKKLGTHVEEFEARQRAEEQARTETSARQRAEEQARTETSARQRAEEQARAETEARQRAEEQARAETEARQHETNARQRAEDRIRELEAMLASRK